MVGRLSQRWGWSEAGVGHQLDLKLSDHAAVRFCEPSVRMPFQASIRVVVNFENLLSHNFRPKPFVSARRTSPLSFLRNQTKYSSPIASTMSTNGQAKQSFTNYVAYCDSKALGQSRIGHLDLESSTIQPLSYVSGSPLSNLYEVIEIGESQIKKAGDTFPLSSVQLLPPISGRDILAVGKNYFEHAIEFNTSGYDSSDKVDQPTHPVIFTKRATSIIAHNEPIFPHTDSGFTETPDYEGEIGVIVGKSGFRIEEKDAMDYVWGYTIINDMTARERQRDHKQFYIGKSPDTFCPIVSKCDELHCALSENRKDTQTANNETGTNRCPRKQASKNPASANTRQWQSSPRLNHRRSDILCCKPHKDNLGRTDHSTRRCDCYRNACGGWFRPKAPSLVESWRCS